MNPSAPQYKKLPGTGHQLGSYTLLYRGPDHLLQISSVTFSERYKRFFFRDIQAFIVLRTNGWLILAGIMIAFALLFTAIAFAVGDSVGSVVFGIFAAVLLLIGVVSIIQGPTCKVFVRTAVQMERIPSLKRLRRVEKILSELQPLIESAQGASTASSAPAAPPAP